MGELERKGSILIISLSGKKQSGKSSVANYLVNKHNFVEISWAGPLKEVVGKQLLRLSHEQLYGPEKVKEAVDLRWDMSPRELLQIIGTDLFRNGLMEDFWVRIGILSIQEAIAKGKNVVVSDTRFPNELKAIEELGGKTIRMKRIDYPTHDQHPSETSLDDSFFEFEVSAMSGQLEHVYLWVDSLVAGKSYAVSTPE